MTEYQNEATQREKLEALRNDTLFSRQQNIADDAGGRYTKLTPSTVTGAADATVPRLPESSPFAKSLDELTGREPEFGQDIETMEPVGTAAEIEQSLTRKED